MKLFHRFFLILLAFALFPIAGAGVWMASTRQAVRDNARFLNGRLAALLADSTARTLEQMNRTLGIVQDLEVAGGQEKIEVPALRRAAAMDSDVALISILNSSGTEIQRMDDPAVYSYSEKLDRSSEPLVVDARRTGRLSIGAPVVVAGNALIPVVHPLSDGRALYMMYSLRGLQHRVKAFADAGRGRVLFTQADGKPVPDIGDPPPTPDWKLPEGGDGWWDSIPSPEGPWVAASAPVPALGWNAVSLQLRRDAYAESDAAAVRAATFLLFLCMVVAGAAFELSKHLLRPVTALIGGADRIARGDFSRPIPPLGWGELDTLGRNFNAMSDKVRGYQELQIERLLEEKAKVEALVRNIPSGVLLVGLDGTIAFANLTAARVLGSTGNVPKDSDLKRAVGVKKMVDAVRAGVKTIETAHIEMHATNGELLAVFACHAFPVRKEGREIGVLVLMRDVTVERELERMKEEFFHAVVHDLRGPITVIDGSLFFLKKMPMAEKEKRYLDMAYMASGRLTGLISNILDIAKLESGTMTLALASVSAQPLLDSVFALSRVPAEVKGVTLAVAPSAGVELVGDAKLLERVLMNLVGNALKFTPSGGAITIGALVAGDQVEFFVRDTGPGIPADKIQAVFEKFKQLDRDTAERAGYGLGLSICTKIVEVHGGRIWVESQEGKGSRFAFRLPRSGPPGRKPELISSHAA